MNKESQEVTSFYNDLWLREWQDMERLNPTARHLSRMIASEISNLTGIVTLLDAGCGMGVNLKIIKQWFPELKLTGADLTPEILSIARQYLGHDENIKLAPLNLETAALNKQFDLVVCNQVLEHIENDDAAILNLRKMCRKYLLVTVPGGSFNRTSKLVGHYRHYARGAIVGKIEAGGFRVLQARQWGYPFHSLYKWALNLLSAEHQKRVGFGKYGLIKQSLAYLLYLLFFGNIFNKGENVVILAEVV